MDGVLVLLPRRASVARMRVDALETEPTAVGLESGAFHFTGQTAHQAAAYPRRAFFHLQERQRHALQADLRTQAMMEQFRISHVE